MSTIAEQMGRSPHLSPLLRKMRFLGLANPDDLRKIAVKRGCSHYRQPGDDFDALPDPGRRRLPDIELAFAMLSASQAFDTRRIRAAVQLLSDVKTPPNKIVRLAKMERCEPLIRQVAEAGARFDDERADFWREILDGVATAPIPPAGRMPHPSRYYAETGISSAKGRTRGKRMWLRRKK
jgi:hypothetical protein